MSFWLQQALADMREPGDIQLSLHELAVLNIICRHADDRGLGSRPGEKRLAASARVRERSLPEFIRRLEAKHWIAVVRRPGRGNLYTVNIAQIKACLPKAKAAGQLTAGPETRGPVFGPTPGKNASTELTTTGTSAGAENLSNHRQQRRYTTDASVGTPPALATGEETIEEINKKTDSARAREALADTPPALPPESVSQSLNNLVSSQSVSPRADVTAPPGPAAPPATARPAPAAPRAPKPVCVERIDPNFKPKAIPLPVPPPPSSAPAPAIPADIDEGNRRALAALMEAVAARKIREASQPPPPPPPPRPQHVLPEPEWLPCPRQAVLAAWDSILARELGPVPPGSDQMVEDFWRTMCRRSQAATSDDGVAAVRRYFQTVAGTPFCVGRAPGTHFKATPRWVMDEGRINDVCAGRYAPRGTP